LLIDFAVGVVLSAIVSMAACRVIIAAGLWDLPTLARKLHERPTPTAGGLGVGVGVGAGLLALTMLPLTEWRALLGPDELRRLAWCAGAAYGFLLIGFIDDTFALGPRAKFAVFVFASVAAVLAAGVARALPIGGGLVIDLGFWIGLVGSMLWVFTIVNCVNFMDGANGLSMGSTAIGLAALGATSLAASATDAAVLSFCGAGALAGFLVWNFPSGRLFAGDSGALFAGAIAAIASLMAIEEGGISPFVPPILFFPLLADALLTLAWRASKKRDLFDGHAEHIYQIGLRSKLKHAQVAVAYWVVTAHCGALGFVASEAWRGAMALENETGAMIMAPASFAPVIAFATLVVIALMISSATRKYAAARGMD
jgi:UDP-GlcNAc:undecaprenyl-phosphate GlcNAc-1-phosphate transferase